MTPWWLSLKSGDFCLPLGSKPECSRHLTEPGPRLLKWFILSSSRLWPQTEAAQPSPGPGWYSDHIWSPVSGLRGCTRTEGTGTTPGELSWGCVQAQAGSLARPPWGRGVPQQAGTGDL